MQRPAIHFGVFYSTIDKYAIIRQRVIPVDGRWMDPPALIRKTPPLDAEAIKALPDTEKRISISVMLDSGEVIAAGSKIVWPYFCSRRRGG